MYCCCRVGARLIVAPSAVRESFSCAMAFFIRRASPAV